MAGVALASLLSLASVGIVAAGRTQLAIDPSAIATYVGGFAGVCSLLICCLAW